MIFGEYAIQWNLYLNQCDQIGRFLKVLVDKFWHKVAQILSTKVAQIFKDVLSYFVKHQFYSQNFYGNFLKKLGYFLIHDLVDQS